MKYSLGFAVWTNPGVGFEPVTKTTRLPLRRAAREKRREKASFMQNGTMLKVRRVCVDAIWGTRLELCSRRLGRGALA